MNNHPYIGQKKERAGWGKWHTVIARKCEKTGKELRVVKNWSGPKPVGGFYCPHCNEVVTI